MWCESAKNKNKNKKRFSFTLRTRASKTFLNQPIKTDTAYMSLEKHSTYPDYDLVLERMRQLVSSKQHILVAVKLPNQTPQREKLEIFFCYKERERQ